MKKFVTFFVLSVLMFCGMVFASGIDMNYKVLIVEDDPMVAMINSQFIAKTDGFEVAGMCRNGQEALDFLLNNCVDLVLLDVFMPVMDGTETLKQIREKKIDTEVIMVTAANDTATIEQTMHLGVHDFLIKPFTFERFNTSLEKFKAKKELLHKSSVMDQRCVDNLIMQGGFTGTMASGPNALAKAVDSTTDLPKGIQKKTLTLILSYFDSHSGWNSTDMIAQALGISIVTVRNYMNYLVKTKRIIEDINYGTGGRPSMLYKSNN